MGTTVGRVVLLAAGSPHTCSSVTRIEFQTSHRDISTHKYLCVYTNTHTGSTAGHTGSWPWEAPVAGELIELGSTQTLCTSSGR